MPRRDTSPENRQMAELLRALADNIESGSLIAMGVDVESYTRDLTRDYEERSYTFRVGYPSELRARERRVDGVPVLERAAAPGKIRIVSDGTPSGTQVYGPHGKLEGVQSVTWDANPSDTPVALVQFASVELDVVSDDEDSEREQRFVARRGRTERGVAQAPEPNRHDLTSHLRSMIESGAILPTEGHVHVGLATGEVADPGSSLRAAIDTLRAAADLMPSEQGDEVSIPIPDAARTRSFTPLERRQVRFSERLEESGQGTMAGEEVRIDPRPIAPGTRVALYERRPNAGRRRIMTREFRRGIALDESCIPIRVTDRFDGETVHEYVVISNMGNRIRYSLDEPYVLRAGTEIALDVVTGEITEIPF